ncbi:MAG: hypothetical protein A2X67_15385 [Ignavibacteria bacterium GWA2_55_11]|nr:MAG: hypothetical protein A2X67_15385 [Ignavibacteria bacterium GWA2_55_11]
MKKTNPVIDAHHHWIPEEHYRHPEPHLRPGDQVVRESDGFHVVRGNMKLFSASALVTQIDEHVKAMDQAGIDQSVLHIGVWLDWMDIKASRFINDAMAEITARHPKRIIPLAHVPPLDSEARDELRRAVLQLGFKGVGINAHVEGILLDDQRFDPFYKTVADLEVPIVVHPAAEISLPRPNGLEQYDLSRNFGRAFDTSINIAHLMLSGTLDRFPHLRFVFSHLGGAFFALKNRLKSSPAARGRSLERYLERIFVDTAPPFWGPEEIRFAVQMMGEEQVVLGSDFPRFPLLEKTVGTVKNAKISAGAKKMILGRTASRLFR